MRRATLRANRLTVAVGRVAGVQAATVAAGDGGLHVAITADRRDLSVFLLPDRASFAIGGAKELSFRVSPAELCTDPLIADVVAAIAAAVARVLWNAALTGAPGSDHGAFVTRDGDRLVADLRTVPEVRWALERRVSAAMIEAIRLDAFGVNEQGLELTIGIEGLDRRR